MDRQAMRPRVVSLAMYKVLESMVKDRLITGMPYSEFKNEKTLAEFNKRLTTIEAYSILSKAAKISK